MRILLRKVMENEGYQRQKTERSAVVYEHLQPDIILLDAIIPVMDGFTCCTQLQKLWQQSACGIVFRQRWEAERTPVLMITVLDDEASINRAFEVGAIDYVTKPIHWAVLRQRASSSNNPNSTGAASKRTAPFPSSKRLGCDHNPCNDGYHLLRE